MTDPDRAVRVFAAWYEAREQGAAVHPSQLLEAHPDIADELRARLSALDIVDDVLRLEESAAPREIGPYRLLRALGSGGMGSVHLAEATEATGGLTQGTRLALKLLHPHLLERPGFFRRFMREADLGRSVDHPNVVRTLAADALVVDGATHHFLVMEYVEGRTLRELTEDLDRLPESLCLHIAAEVGKGLVAIHAVGAVHRDLKPDNVLITEDHVVKVMDLGVAQLADETLRLSQTGAFVGSLAYAAPEQFGGADVDARADLHALGVLLYEIASGVHPYDDDDARVVMRRILEDPPRRLGEVNPQLSPFFEELVHALLAKSADDRFDSAGALLGVLAEAEASEWWRDRARALRRQTKQPLRRIRIPRETAVYGRDADLDRLSDLYRAAKDGDGRVLLLEGEAGIGKTRLVDEFVGRLVASGDEVHFLFAGYPPGGAATASGAFSAAYREHFGDEDLEEAVSAVLPDTPLLVPAFGALLRGDAAPEGVVALTKDSLQTCFVHATRNLAKDRTTIVLIDDLHFAPEEGRALFTSLALAAPGHRILLVGTMRPGVPEDWTANVTRLDQTTHSVLERLGPKDLFELLKDSFRSERLAEDLGMRIAVKSDGNPFFVFEIIRGLREGQLLRQRPDGTWETTQIIDEIEVPSSVLDLVNARVADLSESERNLLDVAACWGFEFDPGLIAEVLGIPRIPALQTLAHIEKKHRLVRSAGRSFVFDHHQVQEALYAALPELLREEYHAALAETLERRSGALGADPADTSGALCVELCDHYLSGERGERALRYLTRALTHLAQGYLHAHLAVMAERALTAPGLLIGVERASVLLQLCSSLDSMGQRRRQEECAREAESLVEKAGDEGLLGQVAAALGTLLHGTSRQEEAEAAIRHALEIALAHDDRKAAANAHCGLGNVFSSLGLFPEARDHYEQDLALSREIGDRRREAGATGNLGNVSLSQGLLLEAREHFERDLALSRETGDRKGEARATGNLGITYAFEGRHSDAREHWERQLAGHREIGYRKGEVAATLNLGNVSRDQGLFSDAREFFERGLALSREIGVPEAEARAHCGLGLVFLSEGLLAAARAHMERYLELSREIRYGMGEAIALVNLGATWHALGEQSRARDALEEAVALSGDIGAPDPKGHGLLDLGRLADDEGDVPLALQLMDESLVLRRAIRHGRGIVESLLELGDLHTRTGNESAARAALEEAVALSRGQGDHAQLVLGLALLACLPGDDSSHVAAVLVELERSANDSRGIRLILWNATRDGAHLTQAKRLLDEALAKVPEEYHEAMCTNVRVNREILAAWREHEGDALGPAERPTSAG